MTVELVRKSASATNGGELDSSVTQVIPGAKTFTGAETHTGVATFSGGAPILGRTDGVAVPANYIGEFISGASAGLSLTSGGGLAATGTAITLTPGIWVIFGYIQYATSTTAVSFSRTACFIRNLTTSTDLTGLTIMALPASDDSPRLPVTSEYVIITATSAIGANVRAVWNTGTVNAAIVLRAVRIA